MISRLGLRLSTIFERTAPDPFVIAVLLSVLTFALAVSLGSFPDIGAEQATLSASDRAAAVFDAWRGSDGLWKFLAFSMQMSLILVTGHALASSRPVARAITRLASVPASTAQGAALVGFIAAATGLINWGLGLIVGALLARDVGRSLAARGVRVHYPLIVAAGYMGLLVWHGGLSGSAPIKSTTRAELATVFPQASLDQLGEAVVTPLNETVGSGLNLFVSGGLLIVIPALLWVLTPRHDDECRPMPEAREAPEDAPEPAPADPDARRSLPDRLATAPVLAWVLAAALIAGIIRYGMVTGLGRVGPNEINATMLGLGLIAHGSLRAYMGAIERAARGCAGIIIQFPLYAGILAMMSASGLIEQIARGLSSIATETTLPLTTLLSAATVNLFVPSGGGQWGVQGPIAMQAGLEAGVAPRTMIMAVAYGDQLTNMLQPFWALPLLAITGARARDIVGYTAIVMVVAGVWMGIGLLLFA